MKIALDVCAVLGATDGQRGFDGAIKSATATMAILSKACFYKEDLGVQLYTCDHVEGQVRKALSQTRRDRYTGEITRPAWCGKDIDLFVKFYKTAVTLTGGSNRGVAPDWKSTAADEALLRGTPDREDGVMFASALRSPATGLCTADGRFRDETNTLGLVWNNGEERIFEFWTVQELAEEFIAAEAALLRLKNAA